MPKKNKKQIKPRKERVSGERPDYQSFFFVGSVSELIELSVLIILVVSYFSVFSADGFVFTQILRKEKGKESAPNKQQIVMKLKEEKLRQGIYPYDIGVIGVRKQYGSTRIEYMSTGQEFELCYAYFPYLENTASCYSSEKGQWE